jgi:uncharacterized protein (TIGR00369 family)
MTETADVPKSPAEWGPPRTKTVTWFDPHGVRALRAGATGLEYVQGIIDGRYPPPPIAELTRSRLTSVGDGEAVFRCVPDESFYNPIGMIHGGLLCTLMDSAMGVAVQTQLPPDTAAATIELKVSYLKPVRDEGELEVVGRVLQVGRRIAFAEAHAYDNSRALVGHSTSSLALAPLR